MNNLDAYVSIAELAQTLGQAPRHVSRVLRDCPYRTVRLENGRRPREYRVCDLPEPIQQRYLTIKRINRPYELFMEMYWQKVDECYQRVSEICDQEGYYMPSREGLIASLGKMHFDGLPGDRQ